VHSGVSRVRNVIALFFMLGSDLYGFDKKRSRTPYVKLVFSHQLGSAGRVLGTKYWCTIFHAQVGPGRFPLKAHQFALRQNCIFASCGIRGSCSVFRCVRGMWMYYFSCSGGPGAVSLKITLDTLSRTCVIASDRIYTSHSAFWCVQGVKCRYTVFHARVDPVRFS
jgi:hypothetical protein